jgi:purine-binding chemotaxis protein CheW
MPPTPEATAVCAVNELEFATFYVGNVLLGIEIRDVQEINRNLDLTVVPHGPAQVRGVMNLRGEVVTVIDLRVVFGLPPGEVTRSTRNIVLSSGDERISLLVDRIADVVSAREAEIESPPGNLSGIEDRFFSVVYKLENELLLIVDVEEVLA